MEDIQEFNEDDYLLNYFKVGLLAAQDADSRVRQMAVHTLAEYEEDAMLVPLFIKMAESDTEMVVRAAAAAALGGAVEQGELEEIPAPLCRLKRVLLRISQGQDDKEVRLQALQALGCPAWMS
jgi:HEAT repeat protein